MFEKIVHIEPTTRCTIACSQCPRTYHVGQYAVRDCDVEATARICANFDRVFMCGNHGDPIYHRQLPELIMAIRDLNASVKIGITTNGSHRSEDWWMQLSAVLGQGDTVNFSIDGLPRHNHIYRTNSHWDSIERGIRALRTNLSLRLRWKWIVFRYNEHDIIEGMQMAHDMGFDSFNTVWSDRYVYGHELTPTRTKSEIELEMRQWQLYSHAA